MFRNQKPLSSRQAVVKVFVSVELAGKTCQYCKSNGVLCWLYTVFDSPFLGAVKVYLKQNMFRFSPEISLETLFPAPKIAFST